MTTPGEAFRQAVEVRGLIPFLSLLGVAAREGRGPEAFDALVRMGVPRARAWRLVEGWNAAPPLGTVKGATPVAVAAAAVVDTVRSWELIDWTAECRRFEGAHVIALSAPNA